jgi:TolB protein
MKTKVLFLLCSSLALFSPVLSVIAENQETQPPQEDFRKQIGTIIVTPGNGPNLAVADFISRSAGLEAATATFNQVLWADLEFAAVSGLVGRSLYPKTLVPDPASLKFDEWGGDPTKADYVAFGNLQNAGGTVSADTYLYDVKTKQQLIASRHTGENRRIAHEFADEVVKLLTGREGIATSKIAYVAGDSIRVMDYDGFNQRNFAGDGPMVRFPQFSPDGRYLAYVSFKTGVPNIVVRSAEGGLIGGTNFNSTTTSPTISSSGQLAFSSAMGGDGSMEIYVSNLDGSGARLTRTPRGINISPRWNPQTGREIAFISDRAGTPQVYVMDSSGANQRPLIARGGQADSPSWSPDGRYVAFTYGGAGSFQIFVADVASGQLLQLTSQGRNESPTWSPDSRHLSFQSNRSGRWEVWQAHIDGSGQRAITRSGGRSPTWAK